MGSPKTHEEAVAVLEAAKEDLLNKKKELRTFRVENGIKKDVPVEDAKVKAKLGKLEKAVAGAQEKLEKAKEEEKGLKPAKARIAKYEYPEGMTDKEKKKLRAKLRREAKAGTDGEKPKKEKKTKKSETEEKGASETAQADDKPKKKAVKKEKKEEAED